MRPMLNNIFALRLGIDAADIRGTYLTSTTAQPCDAEGFEDGVVTAVDGRKLTVGYLALDEDVSDFWSDTDGLGELHIFRSADERDEFITQQEASNRLPLIVDNFRHGCSHWSIHNTRSYPYGGMDTSPRGVYLPDTGVVERYHDSLKAGANKDEAMEAVIEDANAILDEYSLHSSGEVYRTEFETYQFDPLTSTFEKQGVESTGGYIGIETAIEVLQGGMPNARPEPEVSPAPGF